jgi:hypothetical protein
MLDADLHQIWEFILENAREEEDPNDVYDSAFHSVANSVRSRRSSRASSRAGSVAGDDEPYWDADEDYDNTGDFSSMFKKGATINTDDAKKGPSTPMSKNSVPSMLTVSNVARNSSIVEPVSDIPTKPSTKRNFNKIMRFEQLCQHPDAFDYDGLPEEFRDMLIEQHSVLLAKGLMPLKSGMVKYF